MRIVSLLPGATELVCALGLERELVGVSHTCDYPDAARALPAVTRSRLGDESWSSEEIDHRVSRALRDGQSLIELDRELLAKLRPDLIITQEICDVCAVGAGAVRAAAAAIGGAAQVLPLDARTLGDVLALALALGEATGARQAAEQLAEELRSRIERVRERVRLASSRPRVALLTWLDPAFGPGRWAPELIAAAGGTPGLGRAGEPSRRVPWDDVIAFAPEVIVAAPCGLSLERALAEARALLPHRTGWQALPAVRRGRVFLADGDALFGRAGPRLVDGLELLAELLHPELFAGWSRAGAWAPLALAPARPIEV
jgi:iron complex transport system substrate-binding protein